MSALATDDDYHHEETEHAGDVVSSHTHPDGERSDTENEKFDMWNTVDQYDEKHVIKVSVCCGTCFCRLLFGLFVWFGCLVWFVCLFVEAMFGIPSPSLVHLWLSHV